MYLVAAIPKLVVQLSRNLLDILRGNNQLSERGQNELPRDIQDTLTPELPSLEESVSDNIDTILIYEDRHHSFGSIREGIQRLEVGKRAILRVELGIAANSAIVYGSSEVTARSITASTKWLTVADDATLYLEKDVSAEIVSIVENAKVTAQEITEPNFSLAVTGEATLNLKDGVISQVMTIVDQAEVTAQTISVISLTISNDSKVTANTMSARNGNLKISENGQLIIHGVLDVRGTIVTGADKISAEKILTDRKTKFVNGKPDRNRIIKPGLFSSLRVLTRPDTTEVSRPSEAIAQLSESLIPPRNKPSGHPQL